MSGELTAAWREGKELGEFDVFQNCEKDHWNQKALLKFNEALLSTSFNNIEPSHWIKTNPGIICKKIVDGTHKTPKYQTDGVQFLSAKNVRNWKLDKSGCKYISLRCNPEKGTLLLTKSGTIGRMVVLEETPNFSLFESVAILTPSSKKIQVKFIGYSIKVYLEGGGSQKHVKGVAVQHLHLNEIRTLPIKLPPPKEQKEIVRRVESLFAKADKIDQSYTALKEKIDHLPQALLAKAFRGELVPQLPGDGDARDLLEEIRKVREEMSGKVKKGKGKPK